MKPRYFQKHLASMYTRTALRRIVKARARYIVNARRHEAEVAKIDEQIASFEFERLMHNIRSMG